MTPEQMEKLCPAPWTVDGPSPITGAWHVFGLAADFTAPCIIQCRSMGSPIAENEHAEFVALARNAFDVMVRRGWGVDFNEQPPLNGWLVRIPSHWWPISREFFPLVDMRHPDPFTALVEADKWFIENIEKQPATTTS